MSLTIEQAFIQDEINKLSKQFEYCINSKNGHFPRDVFVRLMVLCTSSVKFSFENVMHSQVDGVQMGSPLGPALADIFVGYYELLLFGKLSEPFIYFRYVHDTFATFTTESEVVNFFNKLNSLHKALSFTMEVEKDNSLPFLDVVVEHSREGFLTSIYHKLTFTGLYMNWCAFAPTSRKISLIKTLVHRVLKICSSMRLDSELENIRKIFLCNGYPKALINYIINKKTSEFYSPKVLESSKCPVYLMIPWIRDKSHRLVKQINKTVSSCFPSVALCCIFRTRSVSVISKG